MILTSVQINAVVDWWAVQIQHPKFQTLSSEERQQQETAPVAMAEMMANMLVKDLSEQQIEDFKSALKALLETKEESTPYSLCLSCDYGPDYTLAMAASTAGVSSHNFPWKTVMSFEEDGTITAKVGYGQPYEQVYPV